MSTALSQLSALAHEARLGIFRLLVKAGPEGLAAGEIARRLGVPPNTLSAQLAILSAAQLVGRTREGRSIFYRARYDTISDLIVFLMEDCCQGRAEVCTPVAEAVRCIPS